VRKDFEIKISADKHVVHWFQGLFEHAIITGGC